MRAGWDSWRACLGWGLATVAVSQAFGLFMPEQLAQPIPDAGIDNPVLAFEFARDSADLTSIFGGMENPLRSERIAGMIRGNILDYLFMMVYGSFVLAFFRASATTIGNPRWRMAGWLGALAAVADAIENALLLSINWDMATPNAELGWLAVPVWTKFTALALAAGLAAAAFIRLRGWLPAIMCLPAPILLPFGIADPMQWGQLAVSTIALSWIAMLGWAIWRTMRAPHALTH